MQSTFQDWNRELTIIQHAEFLRLKNKKRSIKRKIYPIDNINNYIQSQIDNINYYIQSHTTRKIPIFS